MNAYTIAEQTWLACALAEGLAAHIGSEQPPVPLEQLFLSPPPHFNRDFNLVEVGVATWDARFVCVDGGSGTIFVRPGLPRAERRYRIARETLRAVVTSEYGARMDLEGVFGESLEHAADAFARALLAPALLVARYRERGGAAGDFAAAFQLPAEVAVLRWAELVEGMSFHFTSHP
jgi:hypothetical protein